MASSTGTWPGCKGLNRGWAHPALRWGLPGTPESHSHSLCRVGAAAPELTGCHSCSPQLGSAGRHTALTFIYSPLVFPLLCWCNQGRCIITWSSKWVSHSSCRVKEVEPAMLAVSGARAARTSDFFALDRQLVSLLALLNNENFRSVRTHFLIDWADKTDSLPDSTDTFARFLRLFLLTVGICNHSTAAKSGLFSRKWLNNRVYVIFGRNIK